MNNELFIILNALSKLEPPKVLYLCHTIKGPFSDKCNYKCNTCPLIKSKSFGIPQYIHQIVSLDNLI